MANPENYFPTRHTHNQTLDRVDFVRAYRPVEPTGISDEPALCFDPVNVLWVRHLVGALHDLTDLRIWKGTDTEKRHAVQQIEKFLNSLKECEVCEDCEDPVTPEPPIVPSTSSSGGGGCDDLEQLEEMLQMAITKIEMRADGLYYRDGCCDWYKVELNSTTGLGGILTPSTKPIEQWTLQDWADAGKPDLPSPGVIPHSNPAYVTQDSIRCAKATALANEVQFTIDVVRQVFLALIGVSTWGAAEVVAALFAAGVTGGWLVVAGIGGAMAAYLVGKDLDAMRDEADGWLGDQNLWVDYICVLTGALYPGEEIEEIDVDQAIKYFLVAIDEDQNHWFFPIMRTFPMQWFQLRAQSKVAETECGCDNYLPYNYTPPSAPGFRIVRQRFFGDGATADAVLVLTNQQAGYIDTLTGEYGVSAGGQGISSEYRGTTSSRHITKSHTVFGSENGEAFVLGEIKFNVQFNGGAQDSATGVFYGLRESDNVWVELATWANPVQPETAGDKALAVNNNTPITKVAFTNKVRGIQNGAIIYATWTQFKFTGTVNGTPFVELPLGQTIP